MQHQCGFSGTILAHDCMHFTWHKRKGYIIQCHYTGESFGDIPNLEKRF
jgi:hypothetical protein